MPILLSGKTALKEASVTTEENDSHGEKKADNNLPEKEKEFASFYNSNSTYIISRNDIVHLTAYSNTYRSTYFQTIIIPPPDRA